MAEDTHRSDTEDEVSIDEVDPEIRPLMEESGLWFEDITEQYYMSTGGMGTLSSLSPYGATFRWVNNGDRSNFYPTRSNSFESTIPEEKVDEVNAISPPTNASRDLREQHMTTTWKKESDGQIYIFEYVPFESPPVTTPEGLKPELYKIMETTPDFEELFNETKSVANSS
jgi:hypothetical protein